jgi:SAM-dependent MidA family methyltransferase
VTGQIATEIAAHGPMRFDAFMARALFDPQHGFYASGQASIGRDGDFYTNVSVGRIFGRVIAAQCAEIWERLGQPARFEIIEQGGNDGLFAADLLEALRDEYSPCFTAVRYTLVEPFPKLVATQRRTLDLFPDKTAWLDSLEALAPFAGVHFTNEYPDALPVRLFVRRTETWLERHVAAREGRLVFEDLFTSDIPGCLPDDAPEDYIAEFCPEAAPWLSSVAEKLTRGLILVADYGYPRTQLYAPWRTGGTLACYRTHRRDEDPLDSPGKKDITAHVDFTGLAEAGLEAGLDLAGYTDQYHFLVGAGTPLLLAMEKSAPSSLHDSDLRAIKSLLHPEIMGTQFKYLALTRGIDLTTPLAGFLHSRPADRELNTSPSDMRNQTAPAPSNPDR